MDKTFQDYQEDNDALVRSVAIALCKVQNSGLDPHDFSEISCVLGEYTNSKGEGFKVTGKKQFWELHIEEARAAINVVRCHDVLDKYS